MGGNAGRFFDDLLTNMWPEEVAFVCFLGVYQAEDGMGPYIIQQLGTENIEDGPFMRVMYSMANRCRKAWVKSHTTGPSLVNKSRLTFGALSVGVRALWNASALRKLQKSAPANAV